MYFEYVFKQIDKHTHTLEHTHTYMYTLIPFTLSTREAGTAWIEAHEMRFRTI